MPITRGQCRSWRPRAGPSSPGHRWAVGTWRSPWRPLWAGNRPSPAGQGALPGCIETPPTPGMWLGRCTPSSRTKHIIQRVDYYNYTHTHTHTHGCTAATHLAHGAVVIASRVQAERSSLTYKRVVVVEASEVAARPYLQGAFWIIAKALAARVAEVQPTQLPTSAGKLRADVAFAAELRLDTRPGEKDTTNQSNILTCIRTTAQ
jgi:hypothetical protein